MQNAEGLRPCEGCRQQQAKQEERGPRCRRQVSMAPHWQSEKSWGVQHGSPLFWRDGYPSYLPGLGTLHPVDGEFPVAALNFWQHCLLKVTTRSFRGTRNKQNPRSRKSRDPWHPDYSRKDPGLENRETRGTRISPSIRHTLVISAYYFFRAIPEGEASKQYILSRMAKNS